MMEPDRTKRLEPKFGSPWLELSFVCKRLHHRLFVRGDRIFASALLDRLHRVLSELPENDMAIIREEGLSLYHHLKNELPQAIEHRRREIQLIEMLQESLRQSVSEGKFDGKYAERILGRMNTRGLVERREILAALEADLWMNKH